MISRCFYPIMQERSYDYFKILNEINLVSNIVVSNIADRLFRSILRASKLEKLVNEFSAECVF